MTDEIGQAGSVCYRLVTRQTMENTRWNRDYTHHRRYSVDLTWLAISQAGVNDFICRQYLHRTDRARAPRHSSVARTVGLRLRAFKPQ
jgi:hypothetical protein